ncbi:hypothetical protein GCM10022223_43800 [Kineosporia mesophila]|uniref:WXG100 family type VII secretion target n=1 Tax=Kineosporia mesophila TaxID=566012 RepID=A0ABP7A128_9ACTN|nr:hypothetical protein [Kineosporia mesophila]MCD5348807.1 hypothetical protein [Kineosporia mesophila]
MATYNFSPNAALDTGAELQFVTGQLQAQLEELWGYVQAFLAANQSISRDSYNAAQATWNAGQAEMNQALAKGVAALDNIHAQYVLADNRGASVFQANL